jgi:hypothetical protein
LNDGFAVHVGDGETCLALYSAGRGLQQSVPRCTHSGSLCHNGIEVDDLDATEQAVAAVGFTPYNHDVQEPGRRFHFVESNAVEYKVVSQP